MKVRLGDKIIDIELDIIDVDTIKLKTPVKTGKLRDGWRVDDGDIVNEVDYADKVENGTVETPGHFMAERSVPQMEDRMQDKVQRQLDEPGVLELPDVRIII